jgi:hypothetical protein
MYLPPTHEAIRQFWTPMHLRPPVEAKSGQPPSFGREFARFDTSVRMGVHEFTRVIGVGVQESLGLGVGVQESLGQES